MKRYNNLFDKIVSLDNLYLADKKARRNKSNRKDIKEFDQNKEESLKKLQQDLINGTYKTSEYNTFIIREPKERLIFRLPYYPDRIVHHAVMNIMEPIWVSIFIKDTYSCIKHRGIHEALHNVKEALKQVFFIIMQYYYIICISEIIFDLFIFFKPMVKVSKIQISKELR